MALVFDGVRERLFRTAVAVGLAPAGLLTMGETGDCTEICDDLYDAIAASLEQEARTKGKVLSLDHFRMLGHTRTSTMAAEGEPWAIEALRTMAREARESDWAYQENAAAPDTV